MKRKVNDVPNVEEPILAYGIANCTPMVAMMGDQYANPFDYDFLKLARKGISKKSLLSLARKIH